MITHAMFSTLICEFQYPDHQEFKKTFMSLDRKLFTREGYSSESTGHVDIHHEPAFEDLYKFKVQCVKEYLDTLSVDSYDFDINVVKSWLNVLKKRSTPKHAHGDAHISFVYYVSLPPNHNQSIQFHRTEISEHEPFPGCIRHNNTKNVWTPFNSGAWKFAPSEGTLYVFPSKMLHDTVGGPVVQEEGVRSKIDLTQRRISIASDVLLTYKEKSAKALGIQPVSNWRKFT